MVNVESKPGAVGRNLRGEVVEQLWSECEV